MTMHILPQAHGLQPAVGRRGAGKLAAAVAALTAAFGLLPAGTAQAQTGLNDRGYWGLGVGQSRYDLSNGVLFGADRRDTSWKLSYGRHLTPYLGAEVSAFDLGSVGRGGGQTKAHGANLSLVGRLPVDRFTLFGKLGTTYGRTHATTAVVSDVAAGKASGWGPSVGLGVSYDLTPTMALVGEWERQRLSFAGSERSDVDNTSIGLRWKF